MAVTSATLDAKIEEVVAAIEAGSYALARQKLAAARALLVALPDLQTSSGGSRWDRRLEDLSQLLTDLGREGAGALGLTTFIDSSENTD